MQRVGSIVNTKGRVNSDGQIPALLHFLVAGAGFELSKLIILPSIKLFLVFQFMKSAVKADAVVATYYCPTLRAFPSLLFLFKKLPDAILLDVFKVLNHAHPE